MARSRRLATSVALIQAGLFLVVACSHTSASPSSLGEDGSVADAACAEDTCVEDQGDADAYAADTGWVCPFVPVSGAGASCDACVQASCDAGWCACVQDKTVNEAGTPGCLADLVCLEDCAEDGGDAGTCPEACTLATYSATETQDARALLSCILQSCTSVCPSPVGLSF